MSHGNNPSKQTLFSIAKILKTERFKITETQIFRTQNCPCINFKTTTKLC